MISATPKGPNYRPKSAIQISSPSYIKRLFPSSRGRTTYNRSFAEGIKNSLFIFPCNLLYCSLISYKHIHIFGSKPKIYISCTGFYTNLSKIPSNLIVILYLYFCKIKYALCLLENPIIS